MKSSASIQRELVFLFTWLLFMLTLGALFDLALPALFVALLAYVLWHLYNLKRLLQWLYQPSKNTPEALGAWDDVFFQLHNKHKRQKKSRKKLAKMLKRFQKSTQALPYATIVLNEGNEIEWFNLASKSLFGFRTSLDIGQRIDNLIRQPEFIKYITNKEFDVPLEFEHLNKNILLNLTRYGKGQILISARDITQQTRLDEMRRDFISDASHELRTPLTVMSGYIEVLQNNIDEKNAFPVEKIHLQTQRMEKIIAELIELAKLETSVVVDESCSVDMQVLLDEVFSEAQAFDNNKHILNMDYADISVCGSHEELRVAVSNLLTNAVRYTPENGEIKLFTEQNESGSYIHVEDNGHGISYEHISRLTERFYRVDDGRSREKGGTGLGLAIVKQILERHGAQLEIHSEQAKGSRFSCFFPAKIA